jgi:molybdenum cofactor cytidylyltransferase
MRVFAVVPAAGHSRRMGQPKLLLPLGGRTVMARLLEALEQPEIAVRAVVMRSDDVELRTEVERCGGLPICPAINPPDMRASVQAALAWIRDTQSPAEDDAWLLIPADHPVLERAVIADLVATFQARRPRFLVPVHEGRRGHPLLARWETVTDVFQLPRDAGLNRLLRERADELLEAPVEAAAVLCDLDTPEDYQRLAAEFPETQ